MKHKRRYLGIAAVAAALLSGFIDPAFAVIPVSFVSYAIAAAAYGPYAWRHRYRCTAITLFLLPFTTALLAIVFVYKDSDLIKAALDKTGTGTLTAGASLVLRASVIVLSALGLDRLANRLNIPSSAALSVQLIGVTILVDMATVIPWSQKSPYLTPIIQVGVTEGDLSRHLLYLPLGFAMAIANLVVASSRPENAP